MWPISFVVVSLPAPDEQVDVAEHLLAGEAAGDAGVVLELGLHELGHHVVGRILQTPVEVLAEASVQSPSS